MFNLFRVWGGGGGNLSSYVSREDKHDFMSNSLDVYTQN